MKLFPSVRPYKYSKIKFPKFTDAKKLFFSASVGRTSWVGEGGQRVAFGVFENDALTARRTFNRWGLKINTQLSGEMGGVKKRGGAEKTTKVLTLNN